MDSTDDTSALSGPALREAKRRCASASSPRATRSTARTRSEESAAIAQRIAALPSFRDAACVVLTLPFRSEWDTRPLIHDALARGATVALPRVNDGSAHARAASRARRARPMSRPVIAASPSRSPRCRASSPPTSTGSWCPASRSTCTDGGSATAAATTTACCRCFRRAPRGSPARSSCRSSRASRRRRTTSRSTRRDARAPVVAA